MEKIFKIQRTTNKNFANVLVIIHGFASIYDGLINILSLGFYHGYATDEFMDWMLKQIAKQKK
tara:strand:+ start:127 stop:315 length:189 start_codon:yes stop_codon:yes gene_type:complete